MKTTPRFYFNLRSPYSWLAVRELTERYPDVAEQVRWQPFWEPDVHHANVLNDHGGAFIYTPMSKEKHLYILQDVRRLATARGLPVSWPIDREPRWEIAHLPYFLAEEAGVGRDYVLAVSQARWEQGLDICDPRTIAEIGARLGLDPIALRGAVEDLAVHDRSREALLALHRDGVFGVPFFIVGREKYWGLDRLPAFVAAFRQQGIPAAPQRAEPASPAAVAAALFDDGHAGGCG